MELKESDMKREKATAEEAILVFYNDYLLSKGVITEEEHRSMYNMIIVRCKPKE